MINIEINDELKELKYTNKSIIALERHLNKSIYVFLNDNSNIMGFYYLTLLLWTGLLHQEPTLTHNKASEYIDGYLKQGKSVSDLHTTMIGALQENKVIQSMVEAGEAELGN